jgi:hypothetical protein
MNEDHWNIIISSISGIAGVIAGTGATWAREHFVSKKKHKDNAFYLAIRITPILDEYLDSCLAVVGDDGTAYGQPAGKDGAYEEQVPTPKKLTYPDDLDWKSIDQSLLRKIMSLPSEAYFAEMVISTERNEPNSPLDYGDVIAVRRYQYAHICLKCIALLHEMRTKFKIDSRQYPNDWEPKTYCENVVHMFEEAQRKREESNSKLWEDLQK